MAADVGLYSKAIISSGVAASATAIAALADGNVSGVEWIAIVVAFLVAFGAVWLVPNQPAGVAKYGKAITAALIAGAGALSVALANGAGVSPAEVITIGVAVAGALGFVIPVPNAASSDPVVDGKLVGVSTEDKAAAIANDVTMGLPDAEVKDEGKPADDDAVLVLDDGVSEGVDYGSAEASR